MITAPYQFRILTPMMIESITQERERYDRRPKRRHNREKVADAPILAMKARKPPKGGKSRAEAKSALSVRKHGDMRHVSEKRDFITMLVRGKFP
jgi:hypothetical protein